jgi:hypothetical protein
MKLGCLGAASERPERAVARTTPRLTRAAIGGCWPPTGSISAGCCADRGRASAPTGHPADRIAPASVHAARMGSPKSRAGAQIAPFDKEKEMKRPPQTHFVFVGCEFADSYCPNPRGAGASPYRNTGKMRIECNDIPTTRAAAYNLEPPVRGPASIKLLTLRLWPSWVGLHREEILP